MQLPASLGAFSSFFVDQITLAPLKWKMSKFKYKKRIVDTMLKRRLMTMGAVLIESFAS